MLDTQSMCSKYLFIFQALLIVTISPANILVHFSVPDKPHALRPGCPVPKLLPECQERVEPTSLQSKSILRQLEDVIRPRLIYGFTVSVPLREQTRNGCSRFGLAKGEERSSEIQADAQSFFASWWIKAC